MNVDTNVGNVVAVAAAGNLPGSVSVNAAVGADSDSVVAADIGDWDY